jgi:hypothetical protein
MIYCSALVRFGSLADIAHFRVMSVSPLKADIHQRDLHVRLVLLTTSRVRPEKEAITRENRLVRFGS